MKSNSFTYDVQPSTNIVKNKYQTAFFPIAKVTLAYSGVQITPRQLAKCK
jgi:hypothetical protein